MIFEFFAVGVGQAGESPRRHAGAEVEAFNIARADLLRIGASSYDGGFDASDVSRRVAMRRIG
jgi:hypothetical protein